jgi:membrane protease subunit (stomatin/prohibitin family)
MGLVGDMGRYIQYQTAQSIPIAAANEGGLAGAGAGIGAGLTIGQTMASAVAGNMANAPQPLHGAKPATESAAELTSLLEKLHNLMTKGVLSKEEFETKKQNCSRSWSSRRRWLA